jgi:hypothetical protein
MLVYILDMLDLSTEIKSSFEKGGFFIRQTSGDSKESCTSLVACMPVEIFMTKGGWASISKGSVMAHLMSSSTMLPYFFITNRTNYSRWMPVYILDMLELPAEIKSAFEKGAQILI